MSDGADMRLTMSLDPAAALAGANQIRAIFAKLNRDLLAGSARLLATDLSAFRANADAKRQVAANLAEGQIRIARRIQEQEMINVSAMKRARQVAADDAVRNHQRVGAAARRASDDAVGGAAKAQSVFAKLSGTMGTLEMVTSALGTAFSVKALVDAGNQIQGVMHAAVLEGEREIENLRQLKKELTEIAAMTGGKEGPTDAEVDKHIKVRQVSGLDRGEARALSMEYHGAAESAVGVNISREDLKKAEVGIARLANTSVEGPDAAGQVGKIAGLIAQLGPTDDKKLLGTTAHTLKVLSEGVGDNSTLIKQTAKVMGAYTDEEGKALFNSPVELASHIAAASKVNPEQAADTVESTARVLVGKNEKWGPLLEKVGIGEHDSYTERSRKLFSHLEQVEASGRSAGAYLDESGVDSHGKKNILSMYKYRHTTEDSLKRNANVMTGQEAENEIEGRYRANPVFRTDIQKANLDAAKLRNAANLQHAEEIRLQAETNLEKNGMGTSSPAGAVEARRIGMLASNSGITLPEGMSASDLGRKIMNEREMARIVESRGQKIPGRPESLQENLSDPEYVAWLVSGGDTAAYSAVGQEHEMTQRVGPARPGDNGSVRVAPPKEGERRLGQNRSADLATAKIHADSWAREQAHLTGVPIIEPKDATRHFPGQASGTEDATLKETLDVMKRMQADTAKMANQKSPPAPMVGPPPRRTR